MGTSKYIGDGTSAQGRIPVMVLVSSPAKCKPSRGLSASMQWMLAFRLNLKGDTQRSCTLGIATRTGNVGRAPQQREILSESNVLSARREVKK